MGNNKLTFISCGVITLHAVGIIWLGWSGDPENTQKNEKKIVVKTVALSKPKLMAELPSPKPPPKKGPPPKPKNVVKKKEASVVKKEETRESGPLIAKAQEMLSKIKKKSDSLQTAKTIDKLEIDSADVFTKYHELVATKIKQVMRLPEEGAVKIHLTLNRSGKVMQIEIISDESESNRDYVKKKLPQVVFPNFGTHLKEEKHTFTITLQSEN